MSRTFLLQDWVTIRGNATSALSVTQDEERWLDLDGFSDAAVWIDVAEVTPPGGSTSSVQLAIETAAVCDEAYFGAMTPPVSLGTAAPFYPPSTTPIVTRSVKSLSTSDLARYVRWKITPSTTGLWDLTFRIRVVATRSPTFVPTSIAGCALWLRSDLGIVPPGPSTPSNVQTWRDQSGNGNDASQPTTTNQPTYAAGGVNNLPKIAVSNTPPNVQYMTGNLSPNVADHTLFAVLHFPWPLGDSASFAATNASNNVNSGFSQFTESPTGIIGRSGNGSSFTTAATTAPTDTSSLGTLGIYSTVAKSSDHVDIAVNGANPTTATTALTMIACPKYLLFTLAVPTQYNFTGDAYEFILYNSVLSDADRRRVHRYLGARYGIAVP